MISRSSKMAFKLPTLLLKSISSKSNDDLESFDFGELKEKEVIGYGAYGLVYKGRFREGIVVVKKVSSEQNKLKNKQTEKYKLKQIQILNKRWRSVQDAFSQSKYFKSFAIVSCLLEFSGANRTTIQTLLNLFATDLLYRSFGTTLLLVKGRVLARQGVKLDD